MAAAADPIAVPSDPIALPADPLARCEVKSSDVEQTLLLSSDVRGHPLSSQHEIPGSLSASSSGSTAITCCSHINNKCKKLKQFKTRCKDDMVNSDN